MIYYVGFVQVWGYPKPSSQSRPFRYWNPWFRMVLGYPHFRKPSSLSICHWNSFKANLCAWRIFLLRKRFITDPDERKPPFSGFCTSINGPAKIPVTNHTKPSGKQSSKWMPLNLHFSLHQIQWNYITLPFVDSQNPMEIPWKSPFFMVKYPFFMVKSQFSMAKSASNPMLPLGGCPGPAPWKTWPTWFFSDLMASNGWFFWFVLDHWIPSRHRFQ